MPTMMRGRLLGMGAGADLEVDLRRGDLEFAEETPDMSSS